MSKYFLLNILFLFCFFVGNISADTFTRIDAEDNHKKDSLFIIELRERFDKIDRQHSDEALILIDSLIALWDGNRIDQSQKEVIRNTFDRFGNMRLRTWPNEALYVKVLIEVVNTSNHRQNFSGLHNSFAGMLDLNNQRRFLTYLEKTYRLFKENVVYSSNTVKWQFSNDNYHFEFDSVPRVIFNERGNLVCYSQGDSLMVRQTTGVLLLFEDRWLGNAGRYTWERVELDPDRVYAEFDTYQFSLTRARFTIDSVRFFNYDFFTQHLNGKLEERIVSGINVSNARYPHFSSYEAVHEIKDLFQGIDYIGGFSMLGQRILGSSAEDQEATIKLYRNDSLFVAARAETFSLRHDRIISDRSAVSIYFSGDSLHHPGINMRYLDNKREFSLIRDEQGVSKAPFRNTYHNVDIYCDVLNWNLDENKMELRMIRGAGENNTAVFESNDYFSEIRHLRLQGMDSQHPLSRLSRFSREVGSRKFSIKEYASYLRMDPNSVKRQLINLTYFGFLNISLDDDSIVLNDRLFHYIGAYAGNSDYDVMQITSEGAVNAEVNLNNFDLTIFGVKRIPLSDAKNVVIHPLGETVAMQKNRDLYFHGRIESGLFDFYGQEFLFDYDEFKVQLVNTDSMSFSVRSHEPDSRGQYSYVRVRTVLEGITGELLVDHPENKAGNLPYPRYPIFNSDNESFVYYDEEFIQSGTYRRENVYFRIVPFSIDSLDHATTENISFDGVFVSTGIFPEFKDSLVVQPDYSLGFNTHTPEEGYPVYDGKAMYNGPIDMSYEGLEANGQLNYLNTTIEAKQMYMFPDSARADVNLLTIEAQTEPVEYPPVRARDVDMLYLPFDDNLTFNYKERPIEIYEGLAQSRGSLTVTPDGVDGFGNIDVFEGEMFSENFTFGNNEIRGSNTELEIKTPSREHTNLRLNNYETLVSVHDKKSSFSASDDSSFVEMPLNEYIAYMDELDWDYEEQKIFLYNTRGRDEFVLDDLSKDELIDIDFKGFEFVSTNRAMDSLSFYVDNAEFDQRSSQMLAKGVKIINVADAAIFPEGEEISLLPGAEIQQLQNASLIADTSTRHHYMYDAEIKIVSRNSYNGKAWYDYKNERDEESKLFFEELSVNDKGKTYGLSKVYEENDFHVTTMFPFQGDINLAADKEHFYYEGATKIISPDCGLLAPQWFRFEATLSPDSMMIPVGENLQNMNYDEIRASVMLAGDSLHIYPAIFSRRKHYLDQEIISAKGYLTYDRLINQYVLTSLDKHKDDSLPDNLVRINPNNCEIRGEGDVEFHNDMGQVAIESYGNVIYDLDDNKLELDLIMALDFFFSDDCLDIIKDTLSNRAELQDINLNRQKYHKGMYNIFGVEEGELVLSELNLSGSFRSFPSELDHTFFFADIRLQWDQQTNAFVSTRPIGIGNIQNSLFNKYVNGFFEYRKQRGGDLLTLYIQTTNQIGNRPSPPWFYFYYTQGVMQSISPINDYNSIINEIRPRRRRLDVERGEDPYVFNVSPEYRPFEFFERMKNLDLD